MTPLSLSKSYNALKTSNTIDTLCSYIRNNETNEALKLIKSLSKRRLEASDRLTSLCPLHLAINKENMEVIELLLYKGVNPNVRNEKKLDAFYYAKQTHNVKIIVLMEKYDTDKEFTLFSCCNII